MMKWQYKSENLGGNLHAAANFISKYHPHWDVVTMSSSKGLNTIVVHRVPVKEEEPHAFATVTWGLGDIETLRPNWSEDQCAKFLKKNEKHIVDLLITHGWDILENLIRELEATDGKA